MASRTGILSACVLLWGCVIGDDGDDDCTGGKCDGSGGTCSDKRYGNGVCDLRLECAAPDIDCFVTFDDDAAAATWFGRFETLLAMEEQRPPRKFLTPDDPRWARTRALLDEGWAAFHANRPVGLLRDARPALVMLEDPTPNAFVAPDLETGNAGFAVMVQTGLFETGGSLDGAMGVMMHEFQHVVGLHIVGDTKERTRKFYFADGEEPIGKFAVEHGTARRYFETWKALTDEVGVFYEERLRALPLGGELVRVLQAAIAQAGTMQVPACVTARTNAGALAAEVAATIDPLTGDTTVPATMPGRVDQVMASIKAACFAGFPTDVIGVIAKMSSTTAAAVEAAMSPEDVALVKGKHVLDGLSALLLDRRAKLRMLEADLAAKTGKQWDQLRYFTTEEDADDVSVTVLRAAELQPDAIGAFLVSFLPGDGPARCTDLLARRVLPPYGHDLTDEHHSSCWRAHHARQVAEHEQAAAHRASVVPLVLPSVRMPRPLPIPRVRSLRERLAY